MKLKQKLGKSLGGKGREFCCRYLAERTSGPYGQRCREPLSLREGTADFTHLTGYNPFSEAVHSGSTNTMEHERGREGCRKTSGKLQKGEKNTENKMQRPRMKLPRKGGARSLTDHALPHDVK